MNEKNQPRLVFCFGVLCHLMLIFANKREGIFMSQGTLVSRYVSYVDKNSQLLIADKEGNKDKEVEKYVRGFLPKKGIRAIMQQKYQG